MRCLMYANSYKKKVVGRDANGRSRNVKLSGIMVGYQDVGMYNMTNDNRRAVCKTAPTSVAHHGLSGILPYHNPPIVNYALRTYKAGDETFKLRFERVLEKETLDLLLTSFVHGVHAIFSSSSCIHIYIYLLPSPLRALSFNPSISP